MTNLILLYVALVLLVIAPAICNELMIQTKFRTMLLAGLFFFVVILVFYQAGLGTDYYAYVSLINMLRMDDSSELNAGWGLHEFIFMNLVKIYMNLTTDNDLVVRLLSITNMLIVVIAYLLNRKVNAGFFVISIFSSCYAVLASMNGLRLGLGIALALGIVQLYSKKVRLMSLLLPFTHTSLTLLTVMAYPALIFIVGVLYLAGESYSIFGYVEDKVSSYSYSDISFLGTALLFVGNLCLIWALKRWCSKTIFSAAIGICTFGFVFSFFSYLGIRIQGIFPIMVCFWTAFVGVSEEIFLRITRHPGFRAAVIIFAAVSVSGLTTQVFYQ